MKCLVKNNLKSLPPIENIKSLLVKYPVVSPASVLSLYGQYFYIKSVEQYLIESVSSYW